MTSDPGIDSSWRFRPARPEDEPVLLALFEESFGTRVTAEHWRWKLHRPSDATAESWVGVDSEDRPVFHYGGMWCDVVIGDEIRPAVVAVDSFTAPAVRRRGLLTLGASRVHQAWRDSGAALVFGLPNEQLGSRANATLGRDLIELRWRVCILRPMKVLLRRLGQNPEASPETQTREMPSQGPSAAIEEIPAESEIQELIRRSREDGQFRMLTEHRRWLWRFHDSPMWRYEVIAIRHENRLDAIAAVKIIEGNRTAVISALEAADERSGREILRVVARDLKARGFSTLRALAPTASPLERTLKRSGFRLPHRGFRLHIKPCVSDLPLGALHRSELWWLNAGDFDVG